MQVEPLPPGLRVGCRGHQSPVGPLGPRPTPPRVCSSTLPPPHQTLKEVDVPVEEEEDAAKEEVAADKKGEGGCLLSL